MTRAWGICRRRIPAAAAAALALILTTGCIRSMVRITSNPSDARVTMNYYERGRTPVEIPIIWYWWYRIEVDKEGYEPRVVNERFYAPPWAWPPFDLFFESLPIPIKNTYRRHYDLEPAKRYSPGQQ